tara:strand:+ start:1731 stop:1934 length:204 start_codon:yes stop_codon:yes gene_type:complete
MRRDIIIATLLEKLDGLYLTSNDAFTIIQEELGNNFQIFRDVDLIDEIHQIWEENNIEEQILYTNKK